MNNLHTMSVVKSKNVTWCEKQWYDQPAKRIRAGRSC